MECLAPIPKTSCYEQRYKDMAERTLLHCVVVFLHTHFNNSSRKVYCVSPLKPETRLQFKVQRLMLSSTTQSPFYIILHACRLTHLNGPGHQLKALKLFCLTQQLLL